MMNITPYHARYFANEITCRRTDDNRLSQSLFDAKVDLNPHQIDAALFALKNPLQEGVMLADEVGLGKIKPTDLHDIIQAKYRNKAGASAPAHGLYLVDVGYKEMDK